MESKLRKDFGVRALLATTLVGGFVLLCSWTVLIVKDVELLKAIGLVFSPIIGGVIGFYFGSKKGA